MHSNNLHHTKPTISRPKNHVRNAFSIHQIRNKNDLATLPHPSEPLWSPFVARSAFGKRANCDLSHVVRPQPRFQVELPLSRIHFTFGCFGYISVDYTGNMWPREHSSERCSTTVLLDANLYLIVSVGGVLDF